MARGTSVRVKGRELRMLIARKGLSAEEAALKAGMSPSTVYAMLGNGRVKTATLRRLIETLEVLPDMSGAEFIAKEQAS